ncbi:hypothetical protein RvY_15078 [Ramazzottius varieornatus]|uniref:Tc1-like transposase DDE domain-containing protein n=1 Tax=Ramazzottius varieornatus TaxID=947166 RepID=A0A1D1VTL6_RAMVA|nr:hypothetical protein RvY_15078 [Ramazzottius varieornatus]
MDKLKKDKNYLKYVVFSDEADDKFACGRHTIHLPLLLLSAACQESNAKDLGTPQKDWMHVNAPSHKAKLVQAYLKKCRLFVLPWPPSSPDMNPIENVWNIMWQYIVKRCPNTKQDLERLLHEAWDKLVTPEL